MPFAWTDTIDAATDWASVQFLNTFYAAIEERRQTVGATSVHPFAPVAAGDDVQRADTNGPIGQFQSMISVMLGLGVNGYADPAATFDGAATFPGPMTMATCRNRAGLTGSKFRRKRPREITSTGDTTDTQGNTIANGHRAFLTTSGVLYERVAGAWVVATPPATVDVLDTDLAAPFNCTYSLSSFGAVAPGDYIGPWLFSEMRAMLNQMVWVQRQVTSSTRSSRSFQTAIQSVPWATSKANCETGYLAAATGSPTGASTYWTTGEFHTSNRYRSQMVAVAENFSLSQYAAVARSASWYALSDKIVVGVGVESNLFDANGTVLVEDQYKLVNTTAAGTTNPLAYTFPYASLTSPLPVWCDQPTGTPTVEFFKGFRITDWRVIYKYDVPGGFTYQ